MLTVSKIKKVKDHRITVVFDDDTSGTVDFSSKVTKSPFDRIADPLKFAEAYLDHGVVEWPYDVGVATEFLYSEVHKLFYLPYSVTSLTLDQVKNKVVLGDCLEVLRTLPDDCIDAVVTDPPYGLGREPTIPEIIAFLQGQSLKTKDFMGLDWDIPSIETWKEIARVLKPGGHILCFGGTRTFDLVSLGLRGAELENRDTICNLEGASDNAGLVWLKSYGMPKSTNVSAQIDKRKGAKRKVVGHRTDGRYKYGFSPEAKAAMGSVAHKHSKGWVGDPTEITEAVTEEAKEFEGYGTGLKPCFEPILVFRKPLSEKTLADQAMKTGTGGINIDACRVKHASKADFEAHKAQVEAIKARGGSMKDSWKNSSDLSGANDVKVEGRWPSNVVITHGPNCKPPGKTWECEPGCPAAELDAQSGERPSTLTGRADPNTTHAHPGIDTTTESMWFGKDRTHLGRVYADTGGAARYYPQFGAWVCEPGCPAAELDAQSGVTTSGAMKHEVEGYEGESTTGFIRGRSGPSNQHGDSGGASRFYPSFEGQEPVKVPFMYTTKASRKEYTLNGRIVNDWPMKKPIQLMQWLVKLVTPKGGVVLDPYCGSGSTLHAASLEGFNYVGIDRDPRAVRISTERMTIVNRECDDDRFARSVIDMIDDWAK